MPDPGDMHCSLYMLGQNIARVLNLSCKERMLINIYIISATW